MITTTIVVTDSDDPQVPGKPILRYDVECTSLRDLFKLIRKSAPKVMREYAKMVEGVNEGFESMPF